ncbi:MAG: class I tRNA ligase family protein [Candidatus Shikimatogenerans bostrichidophilus]|nr:MAG: class I tRNA ligase family protein [Candidatus Shikimatogenerans bostrichidophilus]
MIYNPKIIEAKWKKKHKKFNFFKINKNSKKKFYILNMFPYPSGYGLHIGHSIGYIFSDIISKYKSGLKFNVLNPIGFDSFGLPAEQYAINTGNPPIKIINKSIKKYKNQLKNLGVFFNWKKIINTCSSKYYKWTQWIFLKLFNYYFDKKTNKAKKIKKLINKLKKKTKWNKLNNKNKEKILNKYRLAYLKKSYINWCPKLNSVLANEEVVNGKSERGGYLVFKKKMVQWHLRITKYINRLLKDYKYLNWPKYIKNIQKKWIGKKKVYFFIIKLRNKKLKIFVKKKFDKIFNIIFNFPSNYIDFLLKRYKNKKKIINFINKKNYSFKTYKILIIFKNSLKQSINIYISNYYKNNYIKNIYVDTNNNKLFNNIKNNFIINLKDKIIYNFLLKNIYIYNLNDLVFSRQRYWGEPIPIYYKNGIPKPIKIKYLPLKLPFIKKNIFLNKKFQLNKLKKWTWDVKTHKITYNKFIKKKKHIYPLDTNTMPSFAASNWYYLRYISPKYDKFLIKKKEYKYWKNVDLYIGGIEHINGHLLYSRFCNKFLKDINIVNNKEPYKQFINQGTILNNTYSIYKYKNRFISYDNINKYNISHLQKFYIDKKYIIKNKKLDINNIKKNNIYNYTFILNNKNEFLCKKKIEKMSKSKFNIITPEEIIKVWGIDCYRLYLIFLGPFNKKKIWTIDKIKGMKRFLYKIWNFILNIKKYKKYNNTYNSIFNNYINKINLNYKKLLIHKNISLFMKLLNILIKKNISSINIKKKFLILLSPYIPYITEELWYKLGQNKSIFYERQPIIKSNKKEYVKYIIMINNRKKDIIFINKKNNNLNYIKLKIKEKKYFFNKKNFFKKYIFIKNKILNILILQKKN